MGLFTGHRKKEYSIDVSCPLEKTMVLESQTTEEALEWIKNAVECHLISLDASDFACEQAIFETADPMESDDFDELLSQYQESVESENEFYERVNELEEQCKSRADLSGKFVVWIRGWGAKEFAIGAESIDEAIDIARQRFEKGDINLSLDDLVDDEEDGLITLEAMRLEVALELDEVDEDELIPFSTRVQVSENKAWVYYTGRESIDLDRLKSGKWMCFWSDRSWIEERCWEAVESGAVASAKHSNKDNGVACFYVNADDVLGHISIIKYMLENDMIRKKKNGCYYNISFKLDAQTLAGQYGDDYEPLFKLDSFINLETGEFLGSGDGNV